MKTLLPILIAAIVSSCNMSRKINEQQHWIKTASTLAASFETKTAGIFLKKKHVKLRHIAEFKNYHTDTLFVCFDHPSALTLNYHDGTLYIGKQIEYSDTGKALSLMYGISRHVIDGQGLNYNVGEKIEIDKARAEQYVFDVIKKLGGSNYTKLLILQANRIDDIYRKTGAYIAPDTLFSVFSHRMSLEEANWMDMATQKAAAFYNCDRIFGDNPKSWMCKVSKSDEIYFSFYQPKDN